MSKKVEQFAFYISYMDINTYCFWLIDTYGEDAAFVDVIDKNDFMDKCDNPQKYKINADKLLLEIRQCLVDNGFEEEVNACDKAFVKKWKVVEKQTLTFRSKNDGERKAGKIMKVEIKDNSDKVEKELHKSLLVALEKCGLLAEGYAKKLCPVDTGRLRNSIAHAVASSFSPYSRG